MHRILIVEDDSSINRLLYEILTQAGYQAVQAWSGSEAMLLLERDSFDLLLLDLMLPGLTGEEIIAQLRKNSFVPVIVLSAKDAPDTKAAVLRMGADDYMTKPFNTEELLARIEGQLRKASQQFTGSQVYRHKNIVMDCTAHTVTVAGAPISFTQREFAILALLLSNPNKVFTKENIYQSVWNETFMGDDNTVNVHISNLRSKLGEASCIETVWGIGFKLAK